MNSLIKNFCNNYLSDKSNITIEKLNNNFETCIKYIDTLTLTETEKNIIIDMSKNFYQAMVILHSIVNWSYLPTNDDNDLKEVYEDKFNECINNTYRMAERIVQE